MTDAEVPKEKYIVDRLTERTSSMSNAIASKTVHKEEKVIN